MVGIYRGSVISRVFWCRISTIHGSIMVQIRVINQISVEGLLSSQFLALYLFGKTLVAKEECARFAARMRLEEYGARNTLHGDCSLRFGSEI